MTCERAHEWASLELDGELSQLERALLRTHVRRCDACAASIGEIRGFTTALRGAPLAKPSRPLFVPSEPAPARRYRTVALRGALAATFAALAAGLGVVAGSLGEEPGGPPVRSEPEIALLPSDDELRDVRRVRGAREPLGDERLLPQGRVGGV